MGYLISFSAEDEQNKTTREWFHLASGSSFSIADQAIGLNTRIGIPMQRGFYFVSQASFFPNTFGYQYEEFRYEFNVELTGFRIKRFSMYGTAGLNFGYWKRKFTTASVSTPGELKKDNSLMFGGGANYRLKRIQFYADYKYYPKIWSTQASIGIKLNFFPSRAMKNAYFNYLKGQKRKSSSQ
jgi:hypothetical protein